MKERVANEDNFLFNKISIPKNYDVDNIYLKIDEVEVKLENRNPEIVINVNDPMYIKKLKNLRKQSEEDGQASNSIFNKNKRMGGKMSIRIFDGEKKQKIKYYNIEVNVSDEDLYQLQNGEYFNWNWTTEEDENVIIKLHLFKAEEDFGDEEEE